MTSADSRHSAGHAAAPAPAFCEELQYLRGAANRTRTQEMTRSALPRADASAPPTEPRAHLHPDPCARTRAHESDRVPNPSLTCVS